MDEVIKDLLALGKGLSVTFKNMLQKPVTVQYPEEKRRVPDRTRGRHVLHRYQDGLERCVGCLLCQGTCPAGAIYIEPAENLKDAKVSAGERYAKVFDIDLLRCIFCGHCELACPTNAITLENNTAIAGYTRDSLLIHKQELLEPAGTATLGSTVHWDPPIPADERERVPFTNRQFDGSETSAAAVGQGDVARNPSSHPAAPQGDPKAGEKH
jgi:NADH-quinone oxidoreductase subunit I